MSAVAAMVSSGVSKVERLLGARHDRHPGPIAAFRAAVLLPIMAMTSGVGPMNVSPASRQAAANAAFSARNP